MWNQPNPNGPTAVFIARPDGTFRRFDAHTRKAWDAPREQGPIGTYGADGSMYIGVDPRMALDAALPPNAGVPPMRPDRAAAIGASKQQQDQGNNGAISREHAASLHDLAHKANLPESDMQGFMNVLAALAGGEQGAAAQDRNGGARKISRDQARKVWSLAKDKISPAELATLVEMLNDMVDPDLQDEPEGGQTGDQPRMQKRGGGITGDAALRDARREYGLDRIGHCPPYGESVPKSKYLREAERLRRDNPSLALDARTGGAGAEETNADLREALANMAKIGRAY